MTTEQKPSKTLNVVLWTVQIFLAVTFAWASAMKLFQPADKLAAMWPWTAAYPALVKFTGVLDLLAGIGLIFPWLLRIQTRLTIYAAYGTLALMLAAVVFHISRGEGRQIGFNIFIALLAIFIAWGRNKWSSNRN